MGRAFSGVICLFVCLLFHTISQKPMQQGLPNSDLEMFNHESWKPVYFGVKRQGHEAQKNIAGVGHGALLSAGFF